MPGPIPTTKCPALPTWSGQTLHIYHSVEREYLVESFLETPTSFVHAIHIRLACLNQKNIQVPCPLTITGAHQSTICSGKKTAPQVSDRAKTKKTHQFPINTQVQGSKWRSGMFVSSAGTINRRTATKTTRKPWFGFSVDMERSSGISKPPSFWDCMILREQKGLRLGSQFEKLFQLLVGTFSLFAATLQKPASNAEGGSRVREFLLKTLEIVAGFWTMALPEN